MKVEKREEREREREWEIKSGKGRGRYEIVYITELTRCSDELIFKLR